MSNYTKIALVMVFSIGYAIVRYHFNGPVPVEQIPSYLVNKGSSLAAVFFLLFSAYARYINNIKQARYWGKTSLILMGLHVFLSSSLWSMGYYESFFHDASLPGFQLINTMNLKGEIALLTGAIGTMVYLLISQKRPKDITLLMTIAAVMVCLHVGVMGVRGWFKPQDWHGGLPPITLLSFLVAAPCLWFLLIKQPDEK